MVSIILAEHEHFDNSLCRPIPTNVCDISKMVCDHRYCCRNNRKILLESRVKPKEPWKEDMIELPPRQSSEAEFKGDGCKGRSTNPVTKIANPIASDISANCTGEFTIEESSSVEDGAAAEASLADLTSSVAVGVFE